MSRSLEGKAFVIRVTLHNGVASYVEAERSDIRETLAPGDQETQVRSWWDRGAQALPAEVAAQLEAAAQALNVTDAMAD